MNLFDPHCGDMPDASPGATLSHLMALIEDEQFSQAESTAHDIVERSTEGTVVRAHAVFALGVLAESAGDPTTAMSAYRRSYSEYLLADATDSIPPQIHEHLGEMAYLDMDHDEAINHFGAWIDKCGLDHDLSDTIVFHLAMACVQADEFDDADHWFEALIDCSGTRECDGRWWLPDGTGGDERAVQLLTEIGRHVKAGRWAEAGHGVAYLTRVVERGDTWFGTDGLGALHYFCGRVAESQTDLQPAILSYQKAIEVSCGREPASLLAAQRLGPLLETRGDFAAAAEVYSIGWEAHGEFDGEWVNGWIGPGCEADQWDVFDLMISEMQVERKMARVLIADGRLGEARRRALHLANSRHPREANLYSANALSKDLAHHAGLVYFESARLLMEVGEVKAALHAMSETHETGAMFDVDHIVCRDVWDGTGAMHVVAQAMLILQDTDGDPS